MVGYLLLYLLVLIFEIGRGEEKKCQVILDVLEKVVDEIVEYKFEVIVIILFYVFVFLDVFFLNDKLEISGSFVRWGVYGIEFRFKNNFEIV